MLTPKASNIMSSSMRGNERSIKLHASLTTPVRRSDGSKSPDASGS